MKQIQITVFEVGDGVTHKFFKRDRSFAQGRVTHVAHNGSRVTVRWTGTYGFESEYWDTELELLP